MSKLEKLLPKLVMGIALVSVCLLAFEFWYWSNPNALNQMRVESILLSSSSDKQQLEELKPYVQIGEKISAVNRRLSSLPEENFEIERATEHSYGLDGVNLVLAIRKDGTIVGIGRYIHGSGKGPVWMSGPDWQSVAGIFRFQAFPAYFSP